MIAFTDCTSDFQHVYLYVFLLILLLGSQLQHDICVLEYCVIIPWPCHWINSCWVQDQYCSMSQLKITVQCLSMNFAWQLLGMATHLFPFYLLRLMIFSMFFACVNDGSVFPYYKNTSPWFLDIFCSFPKLRCMIKKLFRFYVVCTTWCPFFIILDRAK